MQALEFDPAFSNGNGKVVLKTSSTSKVNLGASLWEQD